MLKRKEVEKILNCSKNTVYKWMEHENLPFYEIDGNYRFDENEINEWLKKRKKQ